jgi:ribosomal protein S18 acetylase RimI-like enzyme
MKLEINELTTTDINEDLILLSCEFFREYENNHPFFFAIDFIDKNEVKDYFLKWLGCPNKKCFVAFDNRKIIGYITVYIIEQENYWKIKRIGHISGLMVDEKYRRQGVGTKLLENARYFLHKEKIDWYTLFTANNNVSGIKYYEKMGMERIYTHFLGSTKK